MLMEIRQIFKKLDIFGKRLNLTYRDQDVYKTYCGACATLILVILLIVFIIFELLSIAEGRIAAVNYMIKNSQNYQKKGDVIKNETFAFAYSDPDIGNDVISYHLSVINTGRLRRLRHPLRIYECTDFVYARLGNKVRDYVPQNLEIKCIDFSKEMLDRGINPVIRFTRCGFGLAKDTKANKTKCRKGPEMDQKLDNLTVWSFVLADQTDFTLYTEKKLKDGFTAIETNINSKFRKSTSLILRNLIVEEIFGIRKGLHQTQVTTMFLRDEEKTTHGGDQKGVVLDLSLELDLYSSVVITKTYHNILDSMAYVGGISKAIGILVFLFVWPVREVLFYKQLINQMFSVCLDKRQVNTAMKLILKGLTVKRGRNRRRLDQEDGDGADEIENGENHDKADQNKLNEMGQCLSPPTMNSTSGRQTSMSNLSIELNDFHKAFIVGVESKNKGLMADIAEQGKIKKEQFYKNMEAFTKNFSEKASGSSKNIKMTFNDLLKAGFGKSRGSKLRKEGYQLHEVLKFDSVKIGLQSWLLKTREKVLKKRRNTIFQNINKLNEMYSESNEIKEVSDSEISSIEGHGEENYLDLKKKKKLVGRAGGDDVLEVNINIPTIDETGDPNSTLKPKKQKNVKTKVMRNLIGGDQPYWDLGDEIDEVMTPNRSIDYMNKAYNNKTFQKKISFERRLRSSRRLEVMKKNQQMKKSSYKQELESFLMNELKSINKQVENIKEARKRKIGRKVTLYLRSSSKAVKRSKKPGTVQPRMTRSRFNPSSQYGQNHSPLRNAVTEIKNDKSKSGFGGLLSDKSLGLFGKTLGPREAGGGGGSQEEAPGTTTRRNMLNSFESKGSSGSSSNSHRNQVRVNTELRKNHASGNSKKKDKNILNQKNGGKSSNRGLDSQGEDQRAIEKKNFFSMFKKKATGFLSKNDKASDKKNQKSKKQHSGQSFGENEPSLHEIDEREIKNNYKNPLRPRARGLTLYEKENTRSAKLSTMVPNTNQKGTMSQKRLPGSAKAQQGPDNKQVFKRRSGKKKPTRILAECNSLESLSKKIKYIYEQSKSLTFYATLKDFFRLWIPTNPFSASKAQLFREVKN